MHDIVNTIAVFLQLTAAVLAIRLIRLTQRRGAWALLGTAIGLMTVRRIGLLTPWLMSSMSPTSAMWYDCLGLAISALLVAGIALIRPQFVDLLAAKQDLADVNDKLARLAAERQFILDHANDFIFRQDPRGVMVYVSDAVERISGRPAAQWLVHFSTFQTQNPVNRRSLELTAEMGRSGRETQPYLVEMQHAAGHPYWLEINKQPFAQGAQVAGFIGVARDVTLRVQVQEERDKLLAELSEAAAKIRVLNGLLPICAWCKKIRDDHGYWNQLERYISDHSDAAFSHGICPDCAHTMFADGAEEFCI